MTGRGTPETSKNNGKDKLPEIKVEDTQSGSKDFLAEKAEAESRRKSEESESGKRKPEEREAGGGLLQLPEQADILRSLTPSRSLPDLSSSALLVERTSRPLEGLTSGQQPLTGSDVIRDLSYSRQRSGSQARSQAGSQAGSERRSEGGPDLGTQRPLKPVPRQDSSSRGFTLYPESKLYGTGKVGSSKGSSGEGNGSQGGDSPVGEDHRRSPERLSEGSNLDVEVGGQWSQWQEDKGKGRAEVTHIDASGIPPLENTARDLAAMQLAEHQWAYINTFREITFKRIYPTSGGLLGRKEVMAAFRKDHPEMGDKRPKGVSRALEKDLMRINYKTERRLDRLEQKRVKVIPDIYKNEKIPKEVLGDGVIRQSSPLLKNLDNMIKTRPDTAQTEVLDRAVALRDYVRGCQQVGRENFSNVVGMQRVIQDNAERLESYFSKFRTIARSIEKYNMNIKRGLDLLVSSHATLVGSLASFSLGEMSVTARMRDGTNPLPGYANHILRITEFYKQLPEGIPDVPSKPPATLPLDHLESYLQRKPVPKAVAQNENAAKRLQKKVDKVNEFMRASTPPEEKASLAARDFQTITRGLDLYESSLLENVIDRVAKGVYGKGATMDEYKEAYNRVVEDLEKFDSYGKNRQFNKLLDERELRLAKSNLDDYVQKSNDLLASIVTETNSHMAGCQSVFHLSNDGAQLRNIAGFRSALMSFGNYMQKLVSSTILGASGHAAARY